jgi:hypothetical protein
VDFRADNNDLTVRFGGGAAVTRMARADIASLGAGPRAQARARVPAAIQGDRRLLDELVKSREFALLPELSYALGLPAATGHRYRPSLVLHAFGLSAAGLLGGVDPARPGVVYRWKLPPWMQRPDVRGIFDRFAPTDCWSGPEEGPNLEGLPMCEGPGCERYPNRDQDCFGMCGAGCECWSWICGDCCFHDFCADHDALLRRCEGSADVVACVASVTVLSTVLLGCDHGWLPF